MPHHFDHAALATDVDSKTSYITQLSILELSLLVACKRTTERCDGSFNFEMIVVGKSSQVTYYYIAYCSIL